MAVDAKKYLAENVVSEGKTVTYRLLSRALKIHSHVAKRMLYEFHKNENAKKPNSVNATYVITGVQQPEPPAANGAAKQADDDGDDFMQSSPYISSSMPNQESSAEGVPTSSIILVREEDLEDAKAKFQEISLVYVYSLEPTVLQDLNVLTDVSREMQAAYAHEDPLEYGTQWGMIQNKNVKRRTGARPPPPPATEKPTTTSSKSTVPAKRPLQSDSAPESKPEVSKPEATAAASDQQQPKPTVKTAPKAKSNLFSSFAKAKPKQKKEETNSPATDPSGTEDLKNGDASEEEPEELFPDSGKTASTSNRESRKEREDKLKMMMEDDNDEKANNANDNDQEMPDVAEPEEEPEEPEEPEEEPVTIEQPPPPSKPAELKEEVTVHGGRRRGKRQVMKKKTVKDDEGYLVTVEEPVWEEFSEDEPAQPPAKKKPAVTAPKAKPATKPGQGNIMAFFGKK